MTDKKFIMECLQKQKEILEEQKFKVAYICLYGSQNYGMDIDTDEYKSDVDMKAVIVPTLDDLVFNSKPVSITVNTEWGQCDIKDIRQYTETVVKANPAYMETLFTPYFIVDKDFKKEFEQIFSIKEKLLHTLRCQFIRAMYGMMCEKEKALCHPYPTIAHKIEKWGYDGKQAHHVLRLWVLMQDYFAGVPLEEALMIDDEMWSDTKKEMMDFKLNRFTLEETKKEVAEIMEKAKIYKDIQLSDIDENRIDYSIRDEFLRLSNEIIKHKIESDIGRKWVCSC